jgi:uncharacterized protein
MVMNQATSSIHTILVGLSCLTVCATPFSSFALTVEEVPNPRRENQGWVTDMADILSDETEAQLNQMITQLEATNRTEMAVVTVPETAPSTSPKVFATELFNRWGIGKAEQNNGVLFLISVGDRRVEIETGYGIEAILPDAQVGHIIDTEIMPRFKQGDFNGGTLAGTQTIASTLTGISSANSSNSNPVDEMPRSQPSISNIDDSGHWNGGAALGGLILLVFTGLSLSHIFRFPPHSRSHQRSSNRQQQQSSNLLGRQFDSGSRSDYGGSSGGGGSGGDFGGGSSGGGGSGGSW